MSISIVILNNQQNACLIQTVIAKDMKEESCQLFVPIYVDPSPQLRTLDNVDAY